MNNEEKENCRDEKQNKGTKERSVTGRKKHLARERTGGGKQIEDEHERERARGKQIEDE